MIYNVTQDTLKIQIQLLKKQINMERRSVSENIKEYVRISLSTSVSINFISE